jgi:hypothetical protein
VNPGTLKTPNYNLTTQSVKKFLISVNLGETDAITFEDFILRKPVPKLWKGAGVVRENCSTHRGK